MITYGTPASNVRTLAELEALVTQARAIGFGDEATITITVDAGFPGSRDPREQQGPTARAIEIAGEVTARRR